MDKLNTFIYEALNKYFNIIVNIGNISLIDLDNLLLLIYVKYFIEENIDLITKEDYNYINRLLECILNSSCLFGNINTNYVRTIRLPLSEKMNISDNGNSLCGCNLTSLFV